MFAIEFPKFASHLLPSHNLEAEGYTVSMVAFQRQGSDFAGSYPVGSEPKVDAYLDLVVTGYGYIAAGIGNSTPYRPICQLRRAW